MKRFSVSLVCLFAAAGCSADAETEPLGESQEELACAYPMGSIGSTNPPSSGRITKFFVTGPKTVSANYMAPSGWGNARNFNWDPAGLTSMTGGWVGTLLTKVTLEPCSAPGPICMTMNKGASDEAAINFAAGGAGAPAPVTSTFEMNEGVTKIDVVDNVTGSYRRLRFTGYHDGQQMVVERTFPGSGGC